MSDARNFNELRKWLRKEIDAEIESVRNVNLSTDLQMRADSKVTAYHRVLRAMDGIEAAEMKAEIENRPSIKEYWVKAGE